MKMVKPKISVIIPVYNAGSYLSDCLESIINQSLKELEIICINDGSTDNSGKTLDKYATKDKRIQVIHKQNEGVAITRNLGIDKASGEYISFVDSDDWISLDFYQKLYEAAESEKADIAACNILHINQTGKQFFLKYQKPQTASSFHQTAKLLTIPKNCYVWNKIYKAEMIKDNKLYFPVGVYFEDMQWMPQALLYAKKVVAIPSASYYYRWVKTSICNSAVLGTKQYADHQKSIDWLDFFILRYSGKTEYKLFSFLPLLSVESYL